jgi:hypothetical protein
VQPDLTPESAPGAAPRVGRPGRLEQAAAFCGAVFVLLALLYITLSPHVDPTASPRKVARAYTDHRTAALFWNESFALSNFFYLFFLGALYNRLRRAESGTGWLALIAFTGGLGLVLTHVVETLSAQVLAWHVAPDAVSSGDLSSVRVLFDLNSLTVYYDAIPNIAGIMAVAILTLRTGVFPRWLGWLGIAMAAAGLVMALGITRPQQGALTLVPENVYAIAWLFIYIPALVYFLALPERSKGIPQ